MSDSGWVEPTSRHPLRWGTYRMRLVAGLTLAFAGAAVVQLTSAYSLVALPTGVFVLVVGWCILPGIGWRRVLAATVGAFTSMLLLNGAAAIIFLTAPLGAWLLLRQRPLLSYLVLVVPALVAFALAQRFAQYGSSVLVLTTAALAVAGSAWLARALAGISRHPHSNSG